MLFQKNILSLHKNIRYNFNTYRSVIKEENKAPIKREFTNCFSWMDVGDTERLYDMLEDDIISDIEETADPEFNNSDIRISITRVLLEKALPF